MQKNGKKERMLISCSQCVLCLTLCSRYALYLTLCSQLYLKSSSSHRLQEVIILTVSTVYWEEDTLSPVNILGMVVCVGGITLHVFFKILRARGSVSSQWRHHYITSFRLPTYIPIDSCTYCCVFLFFCVSCSCSSTHTLSASALSLSRTHTLPPSLSLSVSLNRRREEEEGNVQRRSSGTAAASLPQ